MKGSSQKNKILEQIQKQRRSQSRQNDSKINFLHFQGIQIQEFNKEIDDYLKTFPNLQQLGFQRCKIESLNNLSEYKNINTLNLEENVLDDGCLKMIVQKFPSLTFLNLKKNQIKEFNEIEQLKQLDQLTHLFLDKNPVCEDENFTSKIWDLLPKLKALDGKDKKGKVIKEKTETYEDDEEDEDEDEEEADDDDDDSFSISDDEEDEEYSEEEESESESNKKKKKVKK
ncbi:unnamed protein product [Paramecium primaurelia]|uniref:NXF1/2/3/5-like leucine-rich repeat domain-containing protein n=1 Tax=Paramecium primaurelia TaxID=5886 RepID=A0A8S1K9U5_PARPR|nr:unnamed protein product [Paramecium primaurelia]